MTYRRTLALQLLRAREAAGMTQLELSAELGCSIRTLARVETGTVSADRWVDRWLAATEHRIGVQVWHPVLAAAERDAADRDRLSRLAVASKHPTNAK